MPQPSPEIADALTDVRRAYRLLWAYQKRMLEYAETIFHALGFRNHMAEPELGRSVPGQLGLAKSAHGRL